MSSLPDVLERIVAARSRSIESGRQRLPSAPPEGSEDAGSLFLRALDQSERSSVIAEVKMGSPKLGSLVGRFDPEEQACRYSEAGAVALSVVVEPEFFYGSYELLERCRKASGLPALAKDFVVDDRQIYRASEVGASAILLIAALYQPEELLRLSELVASLGCVPLIELHDAEDASKLYDSDREPRRSWELVGVNNRDLRTFEVDLAPSIELARSLPESALLVAESGIAARSDVERLERAGFDAFLIGEALLTADDPAMKLRELSGR